MLEQNRTFFEFSNPWVAANLEPETLELRSFLSGFNVPDEAVAEFNDFVLDQEIEVTREELEAEADYIRGGIKREIASNLWGVEARYQVILEDDSVLERALGHFSDAAKMARIYAQLQH